MRRRIAAALTTAMMLCSTTAAAQEGDGDPRFRTRIEAGFLDVLDHRIQFGEDGTYIDYVGEGGQEILFPFFRASVEGRFGGRHHVIFLYQPIELQGEVVTTRDWVVDDVTFGEGTPVNTRYAFPFYRASYMYDVIASPDTELGLGASLQLRDATIVFTSVDGTLRRYEQDVGPVPVIKARFRQDFSNDTFFETEVDGFYAPIKYLNGGDSDVVGAIVDASLRYGFVVGNTEAFANARYVGGGGEGTGNGSEFGDGFTKNWLHVASISLGFTYNL